MSLDNNLKKEEIAGGFDPKDDNETFLADKLNLQSSQKSSINPVATNRIKSSYLLVIPAILVILSGLAIATYFLFFDSQNSTSIALTNLDSATINDQNLEKEKATQKDQIRNQKANDSVPEKNIINNIVQNESIADKYSDKEKSFKNENFFFEETPKKKKKINTAPVIKEKKQIAPPAKPPQIKIPKTVVPKEKPKPSPIIKKIPDSTVKITKKEEQKVEKSISTEKIESKITTPAIGNYAIQLLATPSKEEAEILQNKIIKKNIKNVYISTQKKRDIIWYRVRVGNFNSKEEAQEAANNYGWKQVWIDRIK